ncbi:PIN domain-containing protein [Spirochaetia bacterium]|nr:PIN domain-containing protein [Spirochaetia bacterium]
MIKKALIDSDVILDIALARSPFLENSRLVLALAETIRVLGFVTPICIANVHYFLRKAADDAKARFFLSRILTYLTVIPMDHQIVVESLQSGFSDFEDALQYGAAVRNGCDSIITRNTGDYKTSKLPVYTPDEFVRLYRS